MKDYNHHYYHHQGFDDTLRFLQKRYMISCTRCLAVASTYEIEDEMDEEEWEVNVMVMRVMIGMMVMVVVMLIMIITMITMTKNLIPNGD